MTHEEAKAAKESKDPAFVVRYDVQVTDLPPGSGPVIGHLLEREYQLTATERKALPEPGEGRRWITMGWVNPLAPFEWLDV